MAALQLEELRDCHSPRELAEQLSNLPRTLYETYDRILSKISEKHRKPALMFFQWLAFCACPPRLEELAEVICIDFEAVPHPQFCPDLRYNPESVLTICIGLIVTSPEGNAQCQSRPTIVLLMAQKGEIKLAHMSVKEYLLSSSVHKFRFDINEEMSHSLIAQTCLAYLLQFETVDILNENTLGNFPLAPYAAEFWIDHVQYGADDSTGTLQTLIDTLFSPDAHGRFISWVRLHDLDAFWAGIDMSRMPRGSRLYYASLAGLQETSLALLRGGANPNSKGGLYGGALQAAALGGHEMIVRSLLEWGAEVNMPGKNYSSALGAAASRGHKEIVRLLLEEGAEMNMQDGYHGSALREAASKGHEEIVRLLLEKGAEVHSQGGLHSSPLGEAAAGGYEDIVRLLLEKGAKVNVQGENQSSVLGEAAWGGDVKIVRLLLEKGAEVNMQGGHHGSALGQAASRGHEEIVRLLLEKKAEVNMHWAKRHRKAMR